MKRWCSHGDLSCFSVFRKRWWSQGDLSCFSVRYLVWSPEVVVSVHHYTDVILHSVPVIYRGISCQMSFSVPYAGYCHYYYCYYYYMDKCTQEILCCNYLMLVCENRRWLTVQRLANVWLGKMTIKTQDKYHWHISLFRQVFCFSFHCSFNMKVTSFDIWCV